MKSNVERWSNFTIFGAFKKNNNELQGYAIIEEHEHHANFSVLRTNPAMEKFGINAAIVNGILEFYKNKFVNGFYISDGSKNILHQTAFQDYLEKYFNFRKAYCKLHIKYKTSMKIAVNILYPFRKIFSHVNLKGYARQIEAVLKMEEICRKASRN